VSTLRRLLPLAMAICAGPAVFGQADARFLNLAPERFRIKPHGTPELSHGNGRIPFPAYSFVAASLMDRQCQWTGELEFKRFMFESLSWNADLTNATICPRGYAIEFEPLRHLAPKGLEAGAQVKLTAQFRIDDMDAVEHLFAVHSREKDPDEPLAILTWSGTAEVVERGKAEDGPLRTGFNFLRPVEGSFQLEAKCLAVLDTPTGKKDAIVLEPLDGGHLIAWSGLECSKPAGSGKQAKGKPAKPTTETKADSRKAWK